MKNIIAIFLLIGIFAVSGCLGGKTETAAFVGGNEGLALSFMDLPASVFTESVFDINVLVQNKGEADVSAHNATLTLNNAQSLGITDAIKNNTGALDRARRTGESISLGGTEPISWPDATFKGALITEQQTVPFSVDVCYPYETTAIALACAGRTDKVCKRVEEKTVQSSGAPIKVTKFSQVAVQRAMGVELAFTIDVENKGSGDVYDPAAACTGAEALMPSQKDIVAIKEITFDSEPKTPTCLKEPISLWENKGSITCKFDVANSTQDFSAELVVKLNYIYKDRLIGAMTVIPV